MALFCEDIRDEANGILTLVGILPDHINVANPPDKDGNAPIPDPAAQHKNLSRFSVYARIGFDPDYDLGEPVFTLKLPHGEILALGTVTADVVTKAKREAKERGTPLAGIVFRVAFGSFPLKKLGVAKLEVKIGKRTILAGALNFTAENQKATSSTAH
jgi:hypothetical protein